MIKENISKKESVCCSKFPSRKPRVTNRGVREKTLYPIGWTDYSTVQRRAKKKEWGKKKKKKDKGILL